MKKVLGLAAAILLLTASQSWAPPGGVGTGLPIRNLQDLQNVEASSLASDQDSLIWDSASQSYIHSPAASSGDVTGVGDCTDGACLDGTSDGGTNLALYDGDSNKVTISSGNLAGDITMVLPTDDGNNLEFLQTNGSGTLAWAAPAGGGDVTAVGTCASGACLDGTSDGGTTISLYDGDSNKGTIDLADAVGDVTITLQAVTGTVYVTGGTDVADADVADNITIDLAATASALAANGGNCLAGEIPLGVDAAGAVEGCYEPSEADISDLAHTATAIQDGLIVEADLNADEAPTDNDILTFDTTGANFSWQTPAELSLQPLDATLTDLADGSLGEAGVLAAGTYAAASIDGDDLNSNVAGRSLTLTAASPDTLDIDAEIYTDTKCAYWEDPVAGDDFNSVWTPNGFAATITKLWCESDQTVNMDAQIDDGTPADVAGTDLVCDSTPAEDEAGLTGSMADGDRLDFAVTSVSGTPTWVSFCWTYTKDD